MGQRASADDVALVDRRAGVVAAEEAPPVAVQLLGVVAPDFAPQAKVLAEARDVECIVLDVPRLLAEAGPDDLTLFS